MDVQIRYQRGDLMRHTHHHEAAAYETEHFRCEECQMPLWKAGEVVPAGTYVRVDDRSYRAVILDQESPLPATFDGHIALFCISACACKDRADCRRSVARDG